MSQGKYSPRLPNCNKDFDYYKFNARGELPPPYDHETDTWNEELHFGDYDEEGFDRYGYSAYDSDGKFVGLGQGIDRNGLSEMDYLSMTAEEFNNLPQNCG
jgi:hypothetical protein